MSWGDIMASKKTFDSSLLYQTIIQEFKDPQSFANKINMPIYRLNGILDGKLDPSTKDIHTFTKALNIPQDKVSRYFFTYNVGKNSAKIERSKTQ